jgi:DNA-directed RNA polymerase subunit RPC12/RpoP
MIDIESLQKPATAIVVAIVLLVILALRNRATKPVERTKPRGPGNARYVCAKCAGEFLHSNRTITAWEKGTKRIFCDGCHKQWLNKQPRPMQATNTSSPARSNMRHRSPKTSGCLGVLLLLAVIPGVIVYAVHIA